MTSKVSVELAYYFLFECFFPAPSSPCLKSLGVHLAVKTKCSFYHRKCLSQR